MKKSLKTALKSWQKNKRFWRKQLILEFIALWAVIKWSKWVTITNRSFLAKEMGQKDNRWKSRWPNAILLVRQFFSRFFQIHTFSDLKSLWLPYCMQTMFYLSHFSKIYYLAMRKILHLNNSMYIKHVTTVLAVQIDFWGRKDFFRKKKCAASNFDYNWNLAHRKCS